MEKQGYILVRIEGGKFYFEKGLPQNRCYFLMNSSVGSKSESWVYYEFLQNGGKRILTQTPFFGGVELALICDHKLISDNYELVRYYYLYRNYRILRRFSGNLIVCLLVAFLCVCLWLFQPSNMWFSLQYGGIALLWGIYQAFSIFHFCKSCKGAGFQCTRKKPRRPGY